MPLYEVELRGSTVEERLTDRPLDVGTTVTIGARRWIVARAARGAAGELRYVCVQVVDEAGGPLLSARGSER